jgi:hypothetical protein
MKYGSCQVIELTTNVLKFVHATIYNVAEIALKLAFNANQSSTNVSPWVLYKSCIFSD